MLLKLPAAGEHISACIKTGAWNNRTLSQTTKNIVGNNMRLEEYGEDSGFCCVGFKMFQVY